MSAPLDPETRAEFTAHGITIAACKADGERQAKAAAGAEYEVERLHYGLFEAESEVMVNPESAYTIVSLWRVSCQATFVPRGEGGS
jgi:hypothetical protein